MKEEEKLLRNLTLSKLRQIVLDNEIADTPPDKLTRFDCTELILQSTNPAVTACMEKMREKQEQQRQRKGK